MKIGRKSNVIIDVIDINGRFVKTIVNNGNIESGAYQFDFEIQDKGAYFVRSIINGHLDVKKVVINI